MYGGHMWVARTDRDGRWRAAFRLPWGEWRAILWRFDAESDARETVRYLNFGCSPGPLETIEGGDA